MGWIAGAISIGGSILGSIGQSEQTKDNQKFSIQEIMQQGSESREDAQFNADTAYYYNQLKRQDEQRGLDQFAKFNSVHNYAPNYVNDNPRVAVPDKPVWNQGVYAPPPAAAKKSGGGFWGKILDPLGLDKYGLGPAGIGGLIGKAEGSNG